MEASHTEVRTPTARWRNKNLICTVSVPVLLACSSAWSQPGERSGVSAMMEEVTITARKVEEGLQDAPISVTAFTGDGLEARGMENIEDVGAVTPNLSYQNNAGAGGSSSVATVYIRGVGQRDFLGTIDNGVGFYIDEVYIARTVGATVDLVDVDRIEVLRGPQGTLFGRNNVGGAMAIYSKRPTDDFEGYADASFGTDNMQRFKLMVSGPITDDLKGNFSVVDASQEGYVDRPDGTDTGDDNQTAARGGLLWDGSDAFEVHLTADYSTEEENGPAFLLVESGASLASGFGAFYNNAVPGACPYPAGLTASDPACFNDQWTSDDANYGTWDNYSNTDTWGTTLRAKWFINDNLTLKSITAYRDLDSEFTRDADSSPLLVTHFYDTFETEQYSQEFQLQGSALGGDLDWIAGLYYFKEEGNNTNILDFAIANFYSSNDFTTESEAIYAQGTWHASDKLDFTLGLRYTQEDKSFDPYQYVISSNIGYNSGDLVVPPGVYTTDASEVTPMVNASYHITDELMAYATYSEGFRSGGFAQRIFPPLGYVPSFDPEYVDSYEIGLKYDSASQPLVINFAAFTMDYTDIQVASQSEGYVGLFEDNIGNAEITGFELEMKWAMTDSLFMELGTGYTDAEYTRIDIQAPLVAAITTDSEFDHVPEWTANLSLAQDFSFENGSLLTARLSGSYHTAFYNNVANTESIKTPEVDIWDLTLGWSSPSDAYTLDLGVKNLTDEQYILSGYASSSIGLESVVLDRGRQWFASARYSF
ncbi:TonB-dependent receptor [Halioxenophilus aromaticivorans]|uniref:TonB-dependent receptor n=1 Tax=Halioxenophilus aromaticivorans TaxID=1306992 RepID=A0AAV3U5W0_9ALTE